MALTMCFAGNCSCYEGCTPCTQLVATMAYVRGWDRLPDGVILAGGQAAVSPDAALRFRFAKKQERREVKQGNIPVGHSTSEHSSSCCDALLHCSTCLAETGCSTGSSVTTCQMQVEEGVVVSPIRRNPLHEINQNGPALAHGARSRE
jgi:hypothetical protein